MNRLKAVELTGEQTKSVKKVAAAYDPKFAALRQKQTQLLTPEQKMAQEEQRKKAHDARKAGQAAKKKGDKKADGNQAQKRGRRNQDGVGGVKFTEEQKKARQALAKEQRSLRTEVLSKLKTVLTEEQLSLLPGAGRKNKGAAKKKDPSEDK